MKSNVRGSVPTIYFIVCGAVLTTLRASMCEAINVRGNVLKLNFKPSRKNKKISQPLVKKTSQLSQENSTTPPPPPPY